MRLRQAWGLLPNLQYGPLPHRSLWRPSRSRGACGADADTIVARNLVRMVAGGSAAHSDHGRDVAHTLLLAAEGKGGYAIQDSAKLRRVAAEFGVAPDGHSDAEIAKALAERALSMFGQQEGELQYVSRAPARRQELWRKLEHQPARNRPRDRRDHAPHHHGC